MRLNHIYQNCVSKGQWHQTCVEVTAGIVNLSAKGVACETYKAIPLRLAGLTCILRLKTTKSQ